MIQTTQLTPGVTLRYCPDSRFKKGAISIQLLRPMTNRENSLNALLPAVMLRGTQDHPDLRSITEHLDDLYGASISALVRRIGDIQTVGFYMSFMEDRFALDGDEILAPMIRFLEETMLRPLLENGVFPDSFVESEKKNLISTIESELNDKRAYAAGQMLRRMCEGDSFAVPRLGRTEDVAAITPEALYDHYLRILGSSPVEIFNVGSASMGEVAQLLTPLAQAIAQEPEPLSAQTMFTPQVPQSEFSEQMDVAQAKLSMGFTCAVNNQSSDFAAMQVFNAIYGAGMTSKLFLNVREKLSLCYYASSAYYGSKGIVTVSSGIDPENYQRAKDEILTQLEECQKGNITDKELAAGKKAIISSLRSTPDSPGSIEGYYATASISGLKWDLEEYIRRVEAVNVADVARAASTVKPHTVFLLKGVGK